MGWAGDASFALELGQSRDSQEGEGEGEGGRVLQSLEG